MKKLIALSAVALLALAACGDDDDGGDDTTVPDAVADVSVAVEDEESAETAVEEAEDVVETDVSVAVEEAEGADTTGG
jgi:hypothetical protein